MKVKELAEKLDMVVLTSDGGLDNDVSGMYICDLLSWVMSHATKGSAWVTVLTHMNVAAVALLTEVSCIIVPEGIPVEEVTLSKAREEGIPVLSTGMNSFELCRKSIQLGI